MLAYKTLVVGQLSDAGRQITKTKLVVLFNQSEIHSFSSSIGKSQNRSHNITNLMVYVGGNGRLGCRGCFCLALFHFCISLCSGVSDILA